jgi:hypothetical protein
MAYLPYSNRVLIKTYKFTKVSQEEVAVLECKMCMRKDLVIGYGDAFMPHGIMPCSHQPLLRM